MSSWRPQESFHPSRTSCPGSSVSELAWHVLQSCFAHLFASDNQGSDTRRGTGIVILNLTGQSEPLLGTNVFPKAEAPRYIKGMWISAAFTLFTGFLALCLRTLLVWENKKLDLKHGSQLELQVGEDMDPQRIPTDVGEENYGPSFRYVL